MARIGDEQNVKSSEQKIRLRRKSPQNEKKVMFGAEKIKRV